MQPEPDPDLGQLVFQIIEQYTSPRETNKTNDINNAVSCYKEAVQFCYVTVYQFRLNMWNVNKFCTFFCTVTLIKIVITPFDKSSARDLSATSCKYPSSGRKKLWRFALEFSRPLRASVRSPYAKFGLDRPSRLAGHRQQTDR